MDEGFHRQPLLTGNGGDEGICRKAAKFLMILVKYGLRLLMLAIFLTWVAVIYLFPLSISDEMFQKWIAMTMGTIYGESASLFLLFTAPVLAIALLGTIYVALFPGKAEDYERKKKKKKPVPSLRLWTFPVIVGGPLGVVSAAELIGIVAFAAYILWAVPAYVLRDLTEGLQLASQGKM